VNNGIHGSADRPRVSSPADRLPSTYFPFPLSGADSPFFPPTAEAFMQAAAAAAAAVGRQVPAAERPPLGTRPEVPTSPAAGDQATRLGEDEEDDAMSALSCVESEDTASPASSPADTMGLVSDPSSQRRATTDVEMIAS